MLNTRRVRMPKRKDGYHEKPGQTTPGPSVRKYPIRYSRGCEERVIGHDVRQKHEFSSGLFSAPEKRANYTRVRAATMPTGECTGGVVGTRKIYSALAIKFSLSHYRDP